MGCHNDASLGGLIVDVGEYFERTGIGMEIFETGSVTLSNGRTAVDNVQAVPFLEGTELPRGVVCSGSVHGL